MKAIPHFRRHAEAKKFLFELMEVRHTEMARTPAEDAIVSILLNMDSYLTLEQLRDLAGLLSWYHAHLRHATLTEVFDIQEDLNP